MYPTATELATRLGLAGTYFEIRIIKQYRDGDYIITEYEIHCRNNKSTAASMNFMEQLGLERLKYVIPFDVTGGEFSELPSGGSLGTHEGVFYGSSGGDGQRVTHAMEKHVEKSRIYLESRVKNEKGRSYASTFLSARDANLFVARTLDKNQSIIEAWLAKSDRPEKKRISQQFENEVVGAVLERSSGELFIGHTCRVVLVSVTSPGGLPYTVMTAMAER